MVNKEREIAEPQRRERLRGYENFSKGAEHKNTFVEYRKNNCAISRRQTVNPNEISLGESVAAKRQTYNPNEGRVGRSACARRQTNSPNDGLLGESADARRQ